MIYASWTANYLSEAWAASLGFEDQERRLDSDSFDDSQAAASLWNGCSRIFWGMTVVQDR